MNEQKQAKAKYLTTNQKEDFSFIQHIKLYKNSITEFRTIEKKVKS